MLRRLRFAAILTLLPALAGCMHFTHKDPCADTVRMSHQVPDEKKSCVFVFLIDPMDPFASATLIEQRDYIQNMGFGKTYYGKPCHLTYFIEKMHWIHERCGTARFAVIGYGSGAEAAQKLVQAAKLNDVPIEVAIYLEPSSVDGWDDVSFAKTTFTVRAEDLIDARAAEGHDPEPNAVRKSQVPMHPQVQSLLERELTLIAFSVPLPKRPEAPRVILAPQMPPPRDTPAKPKPLPPEWQFLRPKEPSEMPAPFRLERSETLPLPKAIQGPMIPKANE